MPIVKSVQELSAEKATMEERISVLENEVAALSEQLRVNQAHMEALLVEFKKATQRQENREVQR